MQQEDIFLVGVCGGWDGKGVGDGGGEGGIRRGMGEEDEGGMGMGEATMRGLGTRRRGGVPVN